MKKILALSLFVLSGFVLPAHAQYTETINANRPGLSQGGFAVGRGVLQVEVGPYYGTDKHKLTEDQYKNFGTEYELRFGLLTENLELNIRGDFGFIKQEIPMAGGVETVSFSNFKANTIGAKYLVYDPYKRHYFDKPNIYSWKANQRFKWWTLIPAISVYAGYNFMPDDRPGGYPFYGEETASSSAKAALITQHNWGGTALIMNFIFDRINDDHRQFSGIFTLTQAVGMRSTIFAEFQTIKDDFYSDEMFRLGGAYLFTQDFQIDISGMLNFKDTPSRWQVGGGVSYRFDFHSKDEKLKDPNDRSGGKASDKAPRQEAED